MRVKVTQTCELREIPELVSNITARAKRRLTAISETKFDSWSPESLIAQISELRFDLADVDYMLEDAQNIVGGYLEATAAPEEGVAEPTEREIINTEEELDE